ncbi:MAG: hypothetical protein AABN95_00540 [Acidobacteriota bacterium]
MTPEELEKRVAYLEENIRALNEATTQTAKAVKQLLKANQAASGELSSTMEGVLQRVCPFPPECADS